MSKKILIVHADNEEDMAKELATPIQEAGYEVIYYETILVGESLTAEASKAINSGCPIVLCGSINSLGTGFAHRLTSAARHQQSFIFPVRMQRTAYIESLSLDNRIAEYWENPDKAINDLINSINKHFPLKNDEIQLAKRNIEERYRELALKSYDIIDLANLPEDDRYLATKTLEIRRLYVGLRVQVDIPYDKEISDEAIQRIEKRRKQTIKISDDQDIKLKRIPLGHRLFAAKRVVILGDPGAGKTTLLRWIATAYLLRLQHNTDWRDLPDISTLPSEDWLPIMIRCREFSDEVAFNSSLEDLIRQSLRRIEIREADLSKTIEVLMNRISNGTVLLLFDGLDEISDISNRIKLSKQITQIQAAYPEIPILVTSRIVGYREMGHRIGSGFEHVTLADLSNEDKDDFARRWCAVTELADRREIATEELIEDIHSTDRIERLTGNPMLLTTMALVKRKIGRLPSRRVDLYGNALMVLLNWRREVDAPINEREAIPQLGYIAYEMCRLGVQELRKDEILQLLENLRAEYPQIHAIKSHTAEEFLQILERRTGLLVESGQVISGGFPLSIFEFRHLTFQEFLAAKALVQGCFPGKDNSKSIANNIAPLAAQIKETELAISSTPDFGQTERVVSENWLEVIRLCVTLCRDAEIDDVLLSILNPLDTEDSSLTTKPRAVLATLCLTDDPNAEESTVRKILSVLIKQINNEDVISWGYTSLATTLKELAISRWFNLIKHLLLEEIFMSNTLIRETLSKMFGIIASAHFKKNPSLKDQWMSEQKDKLESDDINQLGAILTVGYISYFDDENVSPEIVKSLFAILSSPNVIKVEAAVKALRWLNHPSLGDKTWHPLMDELNSIVQFVGNPQTSISTQEDLIKILGNEKRPRDIDILLSKIQDSNEIIRAAAASALGEFNSSKDSLESLLNALTDEVSTVRAEVASALSSFRNQRVLVALLERLENEDDNVQASIIETIGEIGTSEQLDIILARLDSPSKVMRHAVVTALSFFNERKSIQALIAMLKDKNIDIVIGAFNSLTELRNPIIAELLVSEINTDNKFLQSIISQLIKANLTKEIKELLIQELQGNNLDSQIVAINILSEIKDSHILEVLFQKFSDSDPFLKEAIGTAITAQGYVWFAADDIETTAKSFEQVALDKDFSYEHEDVVNNYAFCLILLNRLDEAGIQLRELRYSKYNSEYPLYENNHGILAYLQSDLNLARTHFINALDWIEDKYLKNFNPSIPAATLIIQNDNKVTYKNKLPIDITILINLKMIGAINKDEIEYKLTNLYPHEFNNWVEFIDKINIDSTYKKPEMNLN